MPTGFVPATWIKMHLGHLVETLCLDIDHPKHLSVLALEQSHLRLTLKVSVGAKSFLIKAYNPQTPFATDAFRREAQILDALRPTGLTPPLSAYSKRRLWIALDFVQTAPLNKRIDEETAVGYARELGAWFGKFEGAMAQHVVDAPTNWLDYLEDHATVHCDGPGEADTAFLRAAPIGNRTIAVNPPDLGAFGVDSGGRLLCADFVTAKLKPMGHDLLATGRELSLLFPHRVREVSQALVNGFGRGTDVMAQDQLLDLVRVIPRVSSLSLIGDTAARRRRRFARYNQHAPEPVQDIHEIPYISDRLVAQDPGAKDRLIGVLRGKIGTAGDMDTSDTIAAPQAMGSVAKPPTDAVTDDRELAICGACQGACCRPGRAQMAFLDAPLLERTRASLGLSGLEDAVEYYASALPDQHVAGSCYYHGAEGCALPREHRSDMCNTFMCDPMKRLRATLMRLEPETSVVLYNTTPNGVQNALVLNRESVRPCDPDNLRLDAFALREKTFPESK